MNKMYSPTQIAAGTYLGGPFAGIYFLKSNFDTLGQSELSKKTLLIGCIITILLIGILPFVPENTPNSLIPILYLIPVVMIVKRYQLSKEAILESTEYSFQSSWKVFGMSLAWMLAFFFVAMIFMFTLDLAGMISLG